MCKWIALYLNSVEPPKTRKNSGSQRKSTWLDLTSSPSMHMHTRTTYTKPQFSNIQYRASSVLFVCLQTTRKKRNLYFSSHFAKIPCAFEVAAASEIVRKATVKRFMHDMRRWRWRRSKYLSKALTHSLTRSRSLSRFIRQKCSQ